MKIVVCANQAQYDAWLARTGGVPQEHRPAFRWSHLLGWQRSQIVFLKGWGEGKTQPEVDKILAEVQMIEERRKALLDPFTPSGPAQSHHDEPRKRAHGGT